MALYHACQPGCAARLAYLGPLRTAAVVEEGALGAPVGCPTILFVYVVGASTLLAELGSEAEQVGFVRPHGSNLCVQAEQVGVVWGARFGVC